METIRWIIYAYMPQVNETCFDVPHLVLIMLNNLSITPEILDAPIASKPTEHSHLA